MAFRVPGSEFRDSALGAGRAKWVASRFGAANDFLGLFPLPPIADPKPGTRNPELGTLKRYNKCPSFSRLVSR
jgi:hypothetical protein